VPEEKHAFVNKNNKDYEQTRTMSTIKVKNKKCS
jgi:hypothetical protein